MNPSHPHGGGGKREREREREREAHSSLMLGSIEREIGWKAFR